MASYRPFPPQPSYPPAPPGQNLIPPPPPPHQPSSYPPPPPPDSSFPPPPPPPPHSGPSNLQPPPAYYHPSPQFSQFNTYQPLQPPHPPPPHPSSPPPSSSIPPPPPPPSSPPPPPPPPPQSKDGTNERDKGVSKQILGSGRREQGNSGYGEPSKHQKAQVPHPKKSNGPPVRVETEEERRLRKKREFEMQRQDEKLGQQMKGSQYTVPQKTQMVSAGKGHSSVIGSRMEEKRTAPLLTGERVENRLKKPTTFLCKLK